MKVSIIKLEKISSLFYSLSLLQMPTLKKALAEFALKLSRKWFPDNTIKKYIQNTEKAYIASNSSWEDRYKTTSKIIENYIYSNKRRSDGTKRVIAVQIRAFLNFCISEWYWSIHPEQIAVKKYCQKEARYLNENEEQKILKFLKKEKINLQAGIKLMLTTWLRVDEACNLTKKQFYSAQLIAWVYQIAIQWKWGTTWAIFLPEKTYLLCKKNAEMHKNRSVLWLSTGSLQHAIKRFSEKIRIVFTAHTFRHTYITRLAQNGIELYKIQKLARHKSIMSTSRYLHTSNFELAKTIWILSWINY